jgi:benzoyl-CoA reductase/2-hydroxyglutaryl-CoA dehydratase subunit BcrC/BadD/HgdB
MIGYTDHITFNMPEIQRKFKVIDDNVKLYANQRYYEYMKPYIPYDTGALCDGAKVTKDGVIFGESADIPIMYAPYVYYGAIRGSFHTDKHPLATSYWNIPAEIAHREELSKDVENYIKGRIK